MSLNIDAVDPSSQRAPSKNAAVEQGDRFLKLLIAQMKNQDPLNPLDNAQVTSQMAQVSTVQGIERLNETMGAVLSQIQSLQAASMIGKDILVDGNTLQVSGAGPSRGGYEFPDGADQVSIEIRDAQGKLVATVPQPTATAGTRPFSWDGMVDGKAVAAGSYTFSVSGSFAGRALSASTFSADRVTGVIPSSSGGLLTTASGARLPFNAVRTIL